MHLLFVFSLSLIGYLEYLSFVLHLYLYSMVVHLLLVCVESFIACVGISCLCLGVQCVWTLHTCMLNFSCWTDHFLAYYVGKLWKVVLTLDVYYDKLHRGQARRDPGSAAAIVYGVLMGELFLDLTPSGG